MAPQAASYPRDPRPVSRRASLPAMAVLIQYTPADVRVAVQTNRAGETSFYVRQTQAAGGIGRPTITRIAELTSDFLSVDSIAKATTFFQRTGLFRHNTESQIGWAAIRELQDTFKKVRSGGDPRYLFCEYFGGTTDAKLLARSPRLVPVISDRGQLCLMGRPETMLDAMAAQALVDHFCGRRISECSWCGNEFMPSKSGQRFCTTRDCARKCWREGLASSGKPKR